MMYQQDLFESDAARTLLDQLLEDSRLYHSSADYLKLLDFVVKLRNFVPFNAMLLQIQKPGLSYAASGARLARAIQSASEAGCAAIAHPVALRPGGAGL